MNSIIVDPGMLQEFGYKIGGENIYNVSIFRQNHHGNFINNK